MMARTRRAPEATNGLLPPVHVAAQTYEWNLRVRAHPAGAETTTAEAGDPVAEVSGSIAIAHDVAPSSSHDVISPSWTPVVARPTRSMWGAACATVIAIGIPLGMNAVVRHWGIPVAVNHRNWRLLAITGGAYLVATILIGYSASEGRRRSSVPRGLWATALAAGCGLLLVQLIRLHPLTYGWRPDLIALVAIVPLIIPWSLAGGDRL